jgi:hypothetical protein
MDEYGNRLGEAATPDSGVAAFLLRKNRRYLMRQTSAPPGMAMDPSCYALVVSRDGRVTTALPDGCFEIANTLSALTPPPSYASQLYEKEACVLGTGSDGAFVRIHIDKSNGSMETYLAQPRAGRWEAKLNDALKAGDTVTATQTISGAEESEAVTMEVKPAPEAKNYLVVLK